MSFLRALRAYIGLGPDEDIEDRYLYELNSRRRELDLDELEAEEALLDGGDDLRLELESDDVVIVTPGTGGRAGSRRVTSIDHHEEQRQRSDRPRRTRLRDASPEPEPDLDLTIATQDEFAVGMAAAPGFDVVEEPSRRDLQVEAAPELDDDEILDFLDDDSFAEYIPSKRGNHDARPSEADGRGRHRPAGRNGADDPASSSASPGVRARARSVRAVEDEHSNKAEEAVVRSLDSMRAKPRTLIPESFADAKLVADEFKRDVPVLLNLQGLERELARRLIDFASGICYALDGSMEKIASQVFLLIPESVEVSDEDRRRIEERGYAR
ncbi:MAG: cell division protein SepF [Acidimicrobiales bacterium]